MSTVYIYLLRHPITGEPRYVGMSTEPERRLQRHVRTADQGVQTRVYNWIRSLPGHPWMEIIDCVEGDYADGGLAEQAWIAHYRDLIGWERLTNTSDGGYSGAMSNPETRAKISATLKGRKLTQETIDKVLASRTGYRHSAATKKKLAQSLRGNTNGAGHSPTPETRERIAAAQRGRKRGPLSAELRAKLSAAHKGKPRVPGSGTKKGYKATPEARQALRDAWARRKARVTQGEPC